MISLEQVLLLEQKVESAVAKISNLTEVNAQLNAENAALRSKCAELTNALSAKTEQFSTFEAEQSRIEEGIIKALQQLNTVENVVLAVPSNEVASATETPVSETVEVQNETPAVEETVVEQPVVAEQSQPEPQVEQEAPVLNETVETAVVDAPVSEPVETNTVVSEVQTQQVAEAPVMQEPEVQPEIQSASVQNVQLDQIYSSSAEVVAPSNDSENTQDSQENKKQELFDIF